MLELLLSGKLIVLILEKVTAKGKTSHFCFTGRFGKSFFVQ